MKGIAVSVRAFNHFLYAAGVAQKILEDSPGPIFPTTGYVFPDLGSVNKLVQQEGFQNDIQFLDINGVIIPAPSRRHSILRLITDKNLLASVFPVITPALARHLINPAIGPLLRMEGVTNIVASASPAWLPWAGAVDQLLRDESNNNIQIFHSVQRNRKIPLRLQNFLTKTIDGFKEAGLNNVNITSIFDIHPFPEIVGTDYKNSLPWFGDGWFLNSVAHLFLDAGISPTLRAIMINNQIEVASRVDVLNGKLVPVTI